MALHLLGGARVVLGFVTDDHIAHVSVSPVIRASRRPGVPARPISGSRLRHRRPAPSGCCRPPPRLARAAGRRRPVSLSAATVASCSRATIGGRGAGGCKQGVRIVRDQRGETGLCGRRDIRHDCATPRARDRERAQCAGADVGLQRQHSLERDRDLARDQSCHGRAATAIGHVLQRQAGQLLEQLSGQVEHSAGAGRAVVGDGSRAAPWRPRRSRASFRPARAGSPPSGWRQKRPS